jgi:hypothetical protein
MQLGERIATYDVALALRGESGKFVVTSPAGEIYHVACELNHSIVNLQSPGNGSNPQPFLIQKVAEPVPSSMPEKTMPEKSAPSVNETPMQSRMAKTPFLIDVSDSDSRLEARETSATPVVSRPDAKMMDVADLDLLYQEAGGDAEQPTAWVCLNSESQRDRGKLVTNACTSFNEFDAEIRRLHARLDDIRYRARKKFYQAQVVAAGA